MQIALWRSSIFCLTLIGTIIMVRLGSYSLDPIKVHLVQLRHFSMAQYQFNLKKTQD